MVKQPKAKLNNLDQLRRSPALLLVSNDLALLALVLGVVDHPWKLVRHDTDGQETRWAFNQPNVQLVVLDDQAVAEDERSKLLAEIRKHFLGTPLVYVAGSQSEGNEKLARTNGAHYYTSKPLSPERFGGVLRSFLQAQQIKHST